ncbi:unnamed protein product [Schistosoma margrebowiei]|uniref:Uncharacterized protein n=1 Tax=Schistosoma margrebowiei TaxID=48269 RepID=A0A183MZE4_9TREM|nr:unnamed protein product [Schistosoma margrebowiei]
MPDKSNKINGNLVLGHEETQSDAPPDIRQVPFDTSSCHGSNTSLVTNGKESTLAELTEFVSSRAEILLNRFGQIATDSKRVVSKVACSTQRLSFGKIVSKSPCVICGENHRIDKCFQFLTLAVNDKWANAREKILCFCCFRRGHGSMDCKDRVVCTIEGCRDRNHPLLRKPIQVQGGSRVAEEYVAAPVFNDGSGMCKGGFAEGDASRALKTKSYQKLKTTSMMDPNAPVVPQEISTDQPVLSDEENARLQVELSQVEEEIRLLQETLVVKQRRSNEIKKALGFTTLSTLQYDLMEGIHKLEDTEA